MLTAVAFDDESSFMADEIDDVRADGSLPSELEVFESLGAQVSPEEVAYRVLSADQHPDHDSIAEFRKRHLKVLSGLFLQVLRLCRRAGLVKLGHVALDGTKVKANASKHKAMSYDRMGKAEAELEKEIGELLRRAEEADAEEDAKYGKGRRGDELPEELKRRESRLAKIRAAKAALEAESKEKAAAKAREGCEVWRKWRPSGRWSV